MTGLTGLLANPVFNLGMGLLSGSQGGNPYQSAMQGLASAQNHQALFDRQAREQAARDAFQKGLSAEAPNELVKVARALISTGDPAMAARGAQMMQGALPGQETFGVNPLMLDVGGKTMPFQVGNRGTLRQTQLPEGVKVPEKLVFKDLADRVVALSKKTGEERSSLEKGLREAEGEKARGRIETENLLKAQKELPTKLLRIDTAEDSIADMMAIPGLENFTGAGQELNVLLSRSGTNRADFNALKQSILDQVLMIEFEALKGTGQITEQEAERAQRAATALKSDMSDAMFIRQVKRLQDRLKRLRDTAMKEAGVGLGVQPPAVETEFSIDDLLKKYGNP